MTNNLTPEARERLRDMANWLSEEPGNALLSDSVANEHAADLSAALARIADLEEALRPFALHGRIFHVGEFAGHPDNDPVWPTGDLNLGHFRTAASLLEASNGARLAGQNDGEQDDK